MVKKNGKIVTDPTTVRLEEIDHHRSSTVILIADATFKVLLDSRFLYVFRQAIAANASLP